MKFMTGSARVISRLVGIVTGEGVASASDEAIRYHPYLAFYR